MLNKSFGSNKYFAYILMRYELAKNAVYMYNYFKNLFL